jgi:AAA ATPase domain
MHDPKLAALLGQDVVAARLLADLEDETTLLARLTGGSGSGKSCIARQVATAWRDAGGVCVVAVGDDEHSWKELFPLLYGLAQTPTDWTGLAKTGSRSAIQVGETIVGGPGVGTSIFDLLTTGFWQQAERVLRSYPDLARDVILDLKRLARRRSRLLLICDNAHWWDEASLRLVADVLSQPLREAIPQLRSVAVLMVDTADEQAVVAQEAFEVLVGKCVGQTHQVARCSSELFPKVLEAFGACALTADAVDELFSVTNGHLKWTEQVGRYGSIDDVDGLDTLGNEYVSGLAAARFSSLGAHEPEVIDLLSGAAVLGLSCSERDLECIVDRPRSELRALIRHAEKIGFVERGDERIAFSHDVIRSAILREQSGSRVDDLYLKLSECLAALRPGDYEARAQALLQAEEVGLAREMVALGGVAQIRRGVSIAEVTRRLDSRLSGDKELASYLQAVADGYSAVGRGDFDTSPALRSQQSMETLLMAAERNYLAAICLLGLQTDAGRSEARAILTSWASELAGETELELRFLLLLQQAQVLSDMVDDARDTEIQIEQRLAKRARFDTSAQVLIQIQNRRAGGLMAPEFAEDRIAKSVAFFRAGTGTRSRDQLELFRALTNLAAIEIRLDRNEVAYGHALEAERIAVESVEGGQRLDVLASNLVLAGHRLGAMNLADAIEHQRVIVHSPESSDDNFIQRCNLTAYLLLASRDDEAGVELNVLLDQVQSGFDESPLVYYSSALAVAAAAVAGDIDGALQSHYEMEDFVNSRKWPTAAYLRRRHHLLGEVLPSLDASLPRTDLDQILLGSLPRQVGQAWPYYGRLIPCCELSFWTDS